MPCRAHGPDCRGHANEARHERAVLELTDVARLLEAAGDSADPEEARAVLLLAYDLALRSDEVARIRAEDLDLSASAPTIATRRQKGGKIHVLGIARRTAAALRPFARRRGPLFPGWDARRFQRFYFRLAAAAGLTAERKNPRNVGYSHALRRSRATHMLEDGAELRDIQRRLGHKSVKTTLLYIGMTEKRKRLMDTRAGAMIDELPSGED